MQIYKDSVLITAQTDQLAFFPALDKRINMFLLGNPQSWNSLEKN